MRAGARRWARALSDLPRERQDLCALAGDTSECSVRTVDGQSVRHVHVRGGPDEIVMDAAESLPTAPTSVTITLAGSRSVQLDFSVASNARASGTLDGRPWRLALREGTFEFDDGASGPAWAVDAGVAARAAALFERAFSAAARCGRSGNGATSHDPPAAAPVAPQGPTADGGAETCSDCVDACIAQVAAAIPFCANPQNFFEALICLLNDFLCAEACPGFCGSFFGECCDGCGDRCITRISFGGGFDLAFCAHLGASIGECCDSVLSPCCDGTTCGVAQQPHANCPSQDSCCSQLGGACGSNGDCCAGANCGQQGNGPNCCTPNGGACSGASGADCCDKGCFSGQCCSAIVNGIGQPCTPDPNHTYGSGDCCADPSWGPHPVCDATTKTCCEALGAKCDANHPCCSGFACNANSGTCECNGLHERLNGSFCDATHGGLVQQVLGAPGGCGTLLGDWPGAWYCEKNANPNSPCPGGVGSQCLVCESEAGVDFCYGEPNSEQQFAPPSCSNPNNPGCWFVLAATHLPLLGMLTSMVRVAIAACPLALLAAVLSQHACGGVLASAAGDDASADGSRDADAAAGVDVAAGDAIDGGAEPIGYHDFRDPRFWVVANFPMLRLYPQGVAFDGRYLYWAGEPVARLDTKGRFEDLSSWSTFESPWDGGSYGLALGAVYDASRYVYFGGRPLLRYDTGSTFTSTSSWSSFDPGPFSEHVTRDGMGGGAAVIAGAVFFVDRGPIVHRYSASLDFADPSAWSSIDVSTLSPGATCLGGGVLAFPPYVYFNACSEKVDDGATFSRYDTRLPFGAAASWQFVRLADVDAAALGYARVARDTRYVYLVPGPGPNTRVLRYDTQHAFVVSSFEVLDTLTIPNAPAGVAYGSGGWDGRYLYILGTEVTRYDTTLPFANASSWANAGNPYGLDIMAGMVFDGQYMYFATLPPVDGGSSFARFDARYPPQMPPGFTGSFY